MTSTASVNKSVMEKVSHCFEQQAIALEKNGALVVTDSCHHHCWFFPQLSHRMEVKEEGGGRGGANKKCNCGAIYLSTLPSDTSWTSLSLPGLDVLDQLPLKNVHAPSCTANTLKGEFPDVCDLLSSRIAAIKCAAELSQTVLSIAYIISD